MPTKDETTPAADAGPVEQTVRPAAWIDGSDHPRHLSYVQGSRERQLYGPLKPLYRRRLPMTDEQIDEACRAIWGSNYGCVLSAELQRVIARAIERAHGIGA